MDQPTGISVDSTGKVYVGSAIDNRVLVFPATGGAATAVLGQTDFLTDAPTDGADTMDAPSGLAWDAVNKNLKDEMAENDIPSLA